MSIFCYLDESGTHQQSPTAVVGGLLLQPDSFFYFDVDWNRTLQKHGVIGPIHMKEFVPHGKFGYLRHSQRQALLADLVKVINKYKLATVAARLTTADYQESFAGLFDCKVMSIYGFCFLLSLVLQARAVQASGYSLPIPITLDDGNQYKQQIVEAHSFILDQFQKTEDFINVGYLTIDSDDRLAALQAADLVAWTVRRACTGKFINGFECLPEVFTSFHIEQPLEKKWMHEIAEGIRTKLERNRVS